jgi:hypothetical protein
LPEIRPLSALSSICQFAFWHRDLTIFGANADP